MPKKQRGNSYRAADTIIAIILSGMIGLTISLMTNELLNPIVFHGDIIAAFAVLGAAIGFLGGKRSTNWLDDLLEHLRELMRWDNRP